MLRLVAALLDFREARLPLPALPEGAYKAPAMTEIIDIVAREILDSRGNPTVEVEVTLD